MTDQTLLLAVAVLVTGFLPVLTWALAAFAFRLSPKAARHWLGASVLGVLAQLSFVARDAMPEGARLAAPFLCLILALTLLRRGLQVFGRLPVTDRLHLAFVGLSMIVAALPGFVAGDSGRLLGLALAVLVTVTAMALVAVDTSRFIPQELDGAARRTVVFSFWGLALAAVAFGAFLVWRITVSPDRVGRLDAWAGFGAMLGGQMINVPLAFMVTMRLINKLRRISRHDALTDLLNRRAMEEALNTERLRHQRTGRPYSVLLVDVDHFKRVNDTYGHAAGDAVLVALSALLRRVARNVDLVARMGGEEFCLLLPDTSVAGALQAAERLRMAIERRPVRWHGASMAVTASVGVAEVRHGDETVASLIERADRALYRAKSQGRNCTVVAQEQPVNAARASGAAPLTTP